MMESDLESDQRKKRLQEDLRTLSQIDRRSSVLEIQYEGEMPDVHEFTFHGKGIRQGSDADAKIEFVSLHRVEIRLPFSYPKQPPQIR